MNLIKIEFGGSLKIILRFLVNVDNNHWWENRRSKIIWQQVIWSYFSYILKFEHKQLDSQKSTTCFYVDMTFVKLNNKMWFLNNNWSKS